MLEPFPLSVTRQESQIFDRLAQTHENVTMTLFRQKLIKISTVIRCHFDIIDQLVIASRVWCLQEIRRADPAAVRRALQPLHAERRGAEQRAEDRGARVGAPR